MLSAEQAGFRLPTAVLVCWLGLFCLGAAVSAQPIAPKRVGVLVVGTLVQEMEAFRQGLRDAGYTEGRDVELELRSAQGDYSRVSSLMADLVSSQPQVLVVDTTVAARAAKQATDTIPIVMVTVGDPEGSGLIESLAKPGGNVTGLSMMTRELSIKRLEILKELIPTLKRVGVMWDPSVPWHAKAVEDLRSFAPALGLIVTPVRVQRHEELEAAFSTLRQAHAEALSVLDNAFYFTEHANVLRLAARTKLPVMHPEKQSVEAGGLISYSVDVPDLFRRSVWYVDRILKGAKPRDLPVEQPIKFELVVNLKSAKALGLTIPQSILVRANKVFR